MQRKSAHGVESSAAPSIVNEVLRSPGQPLDSSVRASMEPKFGQDFGDVRVHSDARAAASARAVGAIAYTVGRNVVFGDGHFAPTTKTGQGLLAHELTHVAQNRNAFMGPETPISIGPEGDRFEAEADANSAAVVSGKSHTAATTAAAHANAPARLSRAKFTVGNAAVNIDYGGLSKVTDPESSIESTFTNWSGSAATVIHAQLTQLSLTAKHWVLYALDLLVDNPVAGLEKDKAVERLIDYAPSAKHSPNADKPPTWNFANEALSVSGWFEKALTSGIIKPRGTMLSDVQTLINPNVTSSGSAASSTCPSPRDPKDQLNKAKLETDLPVELETYLKTYNKQITSSTAPAQPMSQLTPLADPIQQMARTYYAPYADRGRGSGNTFVQQWQYSQHLASVKSPAGDPTKEKRLAYLDSRARRVGGGGLFAQVHYDSRCDADEQVLDGIVQKMETRSDIQTLLDPILRQKSYTEQTATPKQVVLSPEADADECKARWKTIKTICHELMHVMVHPDFRRAEKGRQILTEGFPEVLGHWLYQDIKGKAESDNKVKTQMEGGLSAACKTIPDSTIEYKDAGQNAEAIRKTVGPNRFRAAFFLGQLEMVGLQPKLAVGTSNDPLEREADQVASQVVDSSGPAHATVAAPQIQGHGHPGPSQMEAPVIVDDVLSSTGRPLEPGMRRDMEQRLGHDFSRVRVHTDAKAAESAKSVNALAYTFKDNVVFGSGRYAPCTTEGRRLIAHELTHVAQGGHSIARKTETEPESESGIIPVGPLDLGGPALDRARRFEPRFREHRPRVPPVTAAWHFRVITAAARPRGPARTAGFLELMNEAMTPDIPRFPELRFPVVEFRSNQAAQHGEVSLDGNSDTEPGRRGLRADTRTQQHPGEPQRRGFIVLTPGALHPEAGPDFTRRTVQHEYVHFLQNLRGELTARRPGCVATFRGVPVGGNPNREVVAVSTTFARFFPIWADSANQAAQQRPPHHIVEDLMLLQASFRCAEEEIKTAAIDRILASVTGQPERRRILLELVRDVSQRDVASTTLSRSDNAMARLSDALGAPLPRDARLPAPPTRPTFGPLFDLPRAIERSGTQMRERMTETVP